MFVDRAGIDVPTALLLRFSTSYSYTSQYIQCLFETEGVEFIVLGRRTREMHKMRRDTPNGCYLHCESMGQKAVLDERRTSSML